jgi:hypothetical protein
VSPSQPSHQGYYYLKAGNQSERNKLAQEQRPNASLPRYYRAKGPFPFAVPAYREILLFRLPQPAVQEIAPFGEAQLAFQVQQSRFALIVQVIFSAYDEECDCAKQYTKLGKTAKNGSSSRTLSQS